MDKLTKYRKKQNTGERKVKWIIKILQVLWHIIILCDFFARSFFIRLFNRDPVKRRQKEIKNTKRAANWFLRSFNVKLKVKNPELLARLTGEKYLVVSNHSSFLDIFILGAVEKYVFITSTQMSETPVLGSIVRNGGCLYTDRKKKVNLPQEIKRFTEVLSSGFKVVLFPEQAGTDGSTVKEFWRSLFQVAVDAGSTVLPACIRYKRLDGKPITDENRSVVSWYEGINFLKYYWNLMARKLEAELCFLDPLEFDPTRNRSELSDLAYERVRDAFHSYDAQYNLQ